jgi:hypothetical protein
MTYFEQFETELIKKLDGTEDTDSIVRWVSEKVLESYRNGITAGQKGVQVIRKGKSRRGGFAPKLAPKLRDGKAPPRGGAFLMQRCVWRGATPTPNPCRNPPPEARILTPFLILET